MFENTVLKPLGIVVVITAHMVFNGPIPAEITGNVGQNITFQFTFNVSVTEHLAIYSTTNHTKIAEYLNGIITPLDSDFSLHPENMSVMCCLTNLKLRHGQIYSVSLFVGSGLPIESNNKVQVIVREQNGISTVSPMTNVTTKIEGGNPILFSSYIGPVLVVSSVVLLAAALPLLICCLLRTKDKQTTPQPQSSNVTVQETVEASDNAPAPPLVYSVLDFPKRRSAVLECSPSDTEYAAVSYLPEKRQV
ncbi:uncharacterized protein ACO6RY_18738 [Pungitius sinensis]